MSHFWTCAAPQHSEHSKAPVRGRARPSHALPSASQPRQGTNLLWDPSLGLREGMRNTIILDSLQCFSAESRIWSCSKRRRQKNYIWLICLWSDLDRFQHLKGLHLNHPWILKTTLLLGIINNSQFLDLPGLDSVLALVATILLRFWGKWNWNELVYIFFKSYNVTNDLF